MSGSTSEDSGEDSTGQGSVSSGGNSSTDTDGETDGETSSSLAGVLVRGQLSGDDSPGLHWFRIDLPGNPDPVQLTAPGQSVGAVGPVGSWAIFSSQNEDGTGESLFANSLAAPAAAAPQLYLERYDKLRFRAGQMVVTISEPEPSDREAVWVAASTSEALPEPILIHDSDDYVEFLGFGASGDVFYFNTSGNYYSAGFDGAPATLLIEEPCGNPGLGFPAPGLVYGCNPDDVPKGLPGTGFVDVSTGVVSTIFADSGPAIQHDSDVFLPSDEVLAHSTPLDDDSTRHFFTRFTGETSVVDHQHRFAYLQASFDGRWATSIHVTGDPSLHLLSLNSPPMVFDLVDVGRRNWWHPAQPVLFVSNGPEQPPGLARFRTDDGDFEVLPTISRGLPPDTASVRDVYFGGAGDVALVRSDASTVALRTATTLSRVELDVRAPTIVPLHQGVFTRLAPCPLPFQDGRGVVAQGELDGEASAGYVLIDGRDPQRVDVAAETEASFVPVVVPAVVSRNRATTEFVGCW